MSLKRIISRIQKGMKRKMEKIFRNDDGVEVTARDEVQAAAYKNQGFKAVKASSQEFDTEFSTELAGHQPMNAKDMNLAQTEEQAQQAKMSKANLASPQQNVEFATESDVHQVAQKAATKNRANNNNK